MNAVVARLPRPAKLAAWVLAFAPALLMAWSWDAGTLGARPITELLHRTGFWTIRFLLLALAITPLRFAFGWREAPTLRRLLGVTAFCYAAAHLSLYAAQQNFHLVFVVHEITHHVYLLIGFAALTGLGLLAATSTNRAVKRLGKRWKALHRLVFPIAVLGLLHFFMQSKIDVSSATTYAGLFLLLVIWRALPRRQAAWPLSLAALAVAAAILTAEVEAGWYDVATRIDPSRVLRSELVFRFGLHPAMRVLGVGLAIAAAAGLLWIVRTTRSRQASQQTAPRKGHASHPI